MAMTLIKFCFVCTLQPDLNYRNVRVVEEMTKVLRYYMDKGVSGFRLDAVRISSS